MKCPEKHHSLVRLRYRVSEEKLSPHVAMVAKFLDLNTSWSRKYGRKKNEKIDMYDFPVHGWSQEQNSLYFSSTVWQCKWPSLSRTIVEIQNFCYLGNVTSNFSLNKLIKCRFALVVNCNLFHFSHDTLFSCTYYVHWQWTPVFQTHAITAARAFWEMKAALCAAVPQSFRGQHVKASLTRIKSR